MCFYIIALDLFIGIFKRRLPEEESKGRRIIWTPELKIDKICQTPPKSLNSCSWRQFASLLFILQILGEIKSSGSVKLRKFCRVGWVTLKTADFSMYLIGKNKVGRN